MHEPTHGNTNAMRAESRVRALRSLPCRLNNTAISDVLDGLVSDLCPPSTPPLTDLRSQPDRRTLSVYRTAPQTVDSLPV